MKQFHSTVSRRDFMKGLGLAGAGIGTASLVGPKFHDLDELMASEQATQQRPWFVKEREFDNPTIEIDYSAMERHDGRLQGQSSYVRAHYYGKDRVLAINETADAIRAKKIEDDEPGWTYRARALTDSYTRVRYGDAGWAEMTDPAPVQTPEERGEPKWTGSPEEAAKLLRAAMRVYGASLVGYTELSQEHRDRVIFSHEKGGGNSDKYIDAFPPPATVSRPIVFEDVDRGYDGGNKLVIPNKAMWEISVSTQGSNELWRATPSLLGGLANSNTFHNTYALHASTYNFLRYLGHQLIGTIGNDSRYAGAEGAAAVLSGVGEASRQKLYTLTPEYGAPGRLYGVLTDLPLAPTPPIDAGMYRFCHSCLKCANACPISAISTDSEPRWDPPLINGKENIFTVKGTKAFYTDLAQCGIYRKEDPAGCRQCWGNCTFTVNRGAMVHQIVKGTIANVSLFNGFFYKMGETFGYGADQKKAEEWWDLNLPVLGQDSLAVSTDGGYK